MATLLRWLRKCATGAEHSGRLRCYTAFAKPGQALYSATAIHLGDCTAAVGGRQQEGAQYSYACKTCSWLQFTGAAGNTKLNLVSPGAVQLPLQKMGQMCINSRPKPHSTHVRRGVGVTICCPGPIATGDEQNPRGVMGGTGAAAFVPIRQHPKLFWLTLLVLSYLVSAMPSSHCHSCQGPVPAERVVCISFAHQLSCESEATSALQTATPENSACREAPQ